MKVNCRQVLKQGPAGPLSGPPHEPEFQMNGPLSLSLSPSKGERVPKAGEAAVQGLKARMHSANFLPRPTHLKLLAFVLFAWRRLIRSRPLRFAKYQPAVRLGNRKVEQRLLHRLARSQLETAC